MDERKQLLTDKIKAIASPASVFIIIIGIGLIAAGTLSIIAAFIVQSKGLPDSGKVLIFLTEGRNKQSVAGMLVSQALLTWLEANVMFVIGRMLKKIAKDGMPFKPLGKSFRTCGILLMLGFFAPSLIGSAVTGILCMISGDPTSWEFRFDLHAYLIIIAIIVLILSVIFQYGEMLQQEYDDTI